jgi:hypothetical protein
MTWDVQYSTKAPQLRSRLQLPLVLVREKFFVLMCVEKTFAIEAVAPPWFAPVLDVVHLLLNRSR